MEKCEERIKGTKGEFVKMHGGMKNITPSENLHIFTTVQVCLEEQLNSSLKRDERTAQEGTGMFC